MPFSKNKNKVSSIHLIFDTILSYSFVKKILLNLIEIAVSLPKLSPKIANFLSGLKAKEVIALRLLSVFTIIFSLLYLQLRLSHQDEDKKVYLLLKILLLKSLHHA